MTATPLRSSPSGFLPALRRQDPGRERRPRARWELWRSPQDQPAWSRPALLAVAALAALLYAWNIADSGYAYFYSTAVKSMSVSWKAFFYGALDPGATITIDKLAGSFLPQALSARIFGFHEWSLTLPQVIEGVVSVLAMHRIVRRWAGPVPAILAAGLFTLTPVLASMFGHPMEDGALTMCLVLAADAYQRAVLEGRLRSLLLAGMWVGFGFQAKMMQAWIILPALAIGYLVAATPRLRTRLLHLLLAGIVAGAVSFSWIALYTFTPAKDRPYVDGSTNNSAIAMVFGYNGFGRFGVGLDGAVAGFGGGGSGGGQGGSRSVGGPTAVEDAPGGGFGQQGTGTGGGGFPGGGFPGGGDFERGSGGAPGGGFAGGGTGGAGGGFRSGGSGTAGFSPGGQATGVSKLFSGSFVTQIGWLYPLAFAALAFELLAWFRRRKRADRLGGGVLMWGVWLAATMIVFSKISIPHTAYMATLAPPLAALSALGLVRFWRAYRAGGAAAWALPAVVAVQAWWAVHLAGPYGSFLPWLKPVVIVAAVVAVAALVGGLIAGMRAGRAWDVTGADAVVLGREASTPALPSAAESGVSGADVAVSDPARPELSGAEFVGREPGAPGSRIQYREGSGGRFAVALRRLAVTGFAAGVVAMLLMPSAWSLSAFDESYDGSAFNAGAGPSAQGLGLTATATLTTQERELLAYVDAHQGSAKYVMAATSWTAAAPYIEATGQMVLPMGGFSGSVPEPTLAAFQALVKSGALKFVLVSTGGGIGGGAAGGGAGTVTSITQWVESACTTVPAADYGGTTTSTGGSAGSGSQTDTGSTTEGPTSGFGGGGFQFGGGAASGTLYQCTS